MVKTSVGLTNETVGRIADEVSRLYKTKPTVKRSLTTNSMMTELALDYFFKLPEASRDEAFEKVFTPTEGVAVESI